MYPIGRMTPAQAEMALGTLAAVLNTTITAEKRWLEGVFPLEGSRIGRQIPPVVAAPLFAIRKRAVAVYTLDHYVDTRIIAANPRELILDAVEAHRHGATPE